MNFWKGFGISFSSYSKALNFIFTKNLAWFFIFPLILNILLFWGGTSAIGMLIDYLEKLFNESVGLNDATFVGSGALKTTVSWLMYILFKLLYIVAFAYIGGKIVIVFMSPVFSVLSEKVDKIITGSTYPFSAEQMMRDIVRGIMIAFRNMMIEFGIIAILFVIAYIPAIGWLISLLGSLFLFVVTSYFYGFSFMDYTNERKRRTISQSVKFIRKNMGVAIGNGSLFALALIIPFCGTFLAGFVSIVSVVAATIAMNRVE
jgi:CysZ protein